MVSRPGWEENWSPSAIGLSKRDFLKDVLSVFGKETVFSLSVSF